MSEKSRMETSQKSHDRRQASELITSTGMLEIWAALPHLDLDHTHTP